MPRYKRDPNDSPDRTEVRKQDILTPQEREFVQLVARGHAPARAAADVYGKHRSNLGRELMERPQVKRAVNFFFSQLQKSSGVSRQRVLEGFLRAAEVAETLQDPSAMVSAWREVGKMNGYYAVETKKVEVNVTGEVQVRRLNALSDEDLMKLASGQTVEGEFHQIVGDCEAGIPSGDLETLPEGVLDTLWEEGLGE